MCVDINCNKLTRFHGNILSLSENVATIFWGDGRHFLTHPVVSAILVTIQLVKDVKEITLNGHFNNIKFELLECFPVVVVIIVKVFKKNATDPKQCDTKYDRYTSTSVVFLTHQSQFLSSPVAQQVRLLPTDGRWSGEDVRQTAAVARRRRRVAGVASRRPRDRLQGVQTRQSNVLVCGNRTETTGDVDPTRYG